MQLDILENIILDVFENIILTFDCSKFEFNTGTTLIFAKLFLEKAFIRLLLLRIFTMRAQYIAGITIN